MNRNCGDSEKYNKYKPLMDILRILANKKRAADPKGGEVTPQVRHDCLYLYLPCMSASSGFIESIDYSFL
jgi:hypothetical protein